MRKILFIIILFILSNAVYSAKIEPLFEKKYYTNKNFNQVINIKETGKYSFQVHSSLDVKIELHNKQIGKIISGKNRIDKLLMSGLFKIVVYSNNKYDTYEIKVIKYKEINKDKYPIIKFGDIIKTSLKDCEQKSYLVERDLDNFVFIETQGRNLNECNLFSLEKWIVDSKKKYSIIKPIKSHPMQNITVSYNTNAKYLLLTVYGGKPNKWADGNKTHPLYIRYGFPFYFDNKKYKKEVSVFGHDYYLMPRRINKFYFELSDFIKNYKKFRLGYQKINVKNFNLNINTNNSIKKNFKEPNLTMNLGYPSNYFYNDKYNYYLIKVEGVPKTPYKFIGYTSTFNIRDLYIPTYFSINQLGDYENKIDFTGFFTHSKQIYDSKDSLSQNVKNSNCVILGSEIEYKRGFNIYQPIKLYIYNKENQEYIINSDIKIDYKIEPYFYIHPRGYRSPSFRNAKNSKFELERGFFVLTLSPKQKGWVELSIKPESGFFKSFFKDETKNTNRKLSFKVKKINLNRNDIYYYHINQSKNIFYFAARYPLKIDKPFPILLNPGEEETLNININKYSYIKIYNDRGLSSQLFVNGKPYIDNILFPPKKYKVTVKNISKKAGTFVLQSFKEAEKTNYVKDSFFDDYTVKAIPLEKKKPVYLDFRKKETKLFKINIDKSGFYTFYSTGRLRLKAKVRTAINLGFLNVKENAVGKNFIIMSYLLKGEYYLSVTTVGNSAGHTGIFYEKQKYIDGDKITLNKDLKVYLKKYQGIKYEFIPDTTGIYTFKEQGINKTFKSRFEDKDGWPFIVDRTGSFQIYAEKNKKYYYYSFPLNIDTKRSLLVNLQYHPKKYVKGRGPHKLEVYGRLNNVWYNSTKNKKLKYDIYNFYLSSKANIVLKYSAQMQGMLIGKKTNFKLKSNEKKVSIFQTELNKGKYTIKLKNSKKNNRYNYFVSLYSKDLLPGKYLNVNIPSKIPISLSDNSFIELYSRGKADVKAQLIDIKTNKVVYENDDSLNNWNFIINGYLQKGKYILKIESASTNKYNVCSVYFNILKTSKLSDYSNNEVIDLNSGVKIIDLPEQKNEYTLLNFKSQSELKCLIGEYKKNNIKQYNISEGKNIPLIFKKNKKYKIFIWSKDHISEKCKLEYTYLKPEKFNFDSSYKKQPLYKKKYLFAELDNHHPGTFELFWTKNNKIVKPTSFSVLFTKNDFSRKNNSSVYSTIYNKTIIYAEFNVNNIPDNFILNEIKLENNSKIQVDKNIIYDKYFCFSTSIAKKCLLDVYSKSILLGSAYESYKKNKLFEIGDFYSSDMFELNNKHIYNIKTPKQKYLFVWPLEKNKDIDFYINMKIISERKFEKNTDYSTYNKMINKNTSHIYTLPAKTKQISGSLDKNILLYTENKIFYNSDKPILFDFITNSQKLNIVNLSNHKKKYSFVLQKSFVNKKNILSSKNNIVENIFHPEYKFIKISDDRKKYCSVLGKIEKLYIVYRNGEFKHQTFPYFKLKIQDKNIIGLFLKLLPGYFKVDLYNNNIEKKYKMKSIDKTRNFNIRLNKINSISKSFNIKHIKILELKLKNNAKINIYKNGKFYLEKYLLDIKNIELLLKPAKYTIEYTKLTAGYDNFKGLFYSINDIEDTYGKSVLLNYYTPVWYKFNLKEKSQIGIAIQTDNELVNYELYDTYFESIEKGSQFFKTLNSGIYYLKLYTLSDSVIANARPVLIEAEKFIQEFKKKKFNNFILKFKK